MRKLAFACICFSLGIVAAHYIIPINLLVFTAVFLFMAAGIFFLLKKKYLCGILLFVAIGLSYYSLHYSMTVNKAEKLSTDKASVEAVIVSEVNNYDTYSSVRIKFLSKPYNGLKAILYNYNGNLCYSPGDVISFDCKIKPANTMYGEQVDYNIARGIYIKAYLIDNSAEVIGHKYTAEVFGTVINIYFRDAVQQLYDGSEQAFITALMLGNKTELYSDTDSYMALSRAGFMHTVAVSGMHVAFVVAVISFLFGGGLAASVFCLLIIWGFVIVTGASPSAVRAAFMQTVLISSKFFNRENDSITSLSFALSCILLNNPFAVSSASLQLSFAAVLGLCLFAEKIQNIFYIPLRGKKGIKRAAAATVRYISGIAAASLSVMIFTVPLSIYYFGYISLLSFVMNIVCLWAIPICFGGGYLSCLMITVFPAVSTLLAKAVSLLIDFILYTAKFISNFTNAIIYFDLPVMKWWLALIAVSVLICIISKLKKQFKISISIAVIFSALIIAKIGINNTYSNILDSYNVIDVGQGQCIVAICGSNTIMVDCGNQDEIFDNAGDAAANFLYSRERNRIDALYLTHLHSDHSNGIDHLTALIDVKTIIIPRSSIEDEFYESLVQLCEKRNIELRYIDELTREKYERLEVTVYPSDENDSVNERCMKILISDNDYDMLITGDISATVEKAFVDTYELPETEVIIAAHHGSRYSSCGKFLSAVNGEYAVISCGPNSYGHPTYETLERLRYYGYNIFRTDLNGNVCFYIRNQ